MPTIRDTAYPRLKGISSPQDLRCLYTPSRLERAFARRHCVNSQVSACFLVLLKTFQRLGYFVAVRDVLPTLSSTSRTESESDKIGSTRTAMISPAAEAGTWR